MNNIVRRLTLALAVGLVLGVAANINTAPAMAQQQQVPDTQQTQGGDPIRQLNLSPEQREKIRAISEDRKDERQEINRHLREANRALEEALDSDNPDETVVEQRLRDVAAAQAAQMRMRVLTEVRIRRVLSPDQLIRWRELRQQARRDRQMNNQNGNGFERNRPLQNRRNGLGPAQRQESPQQRKP
jgi:Spy/CpxP family protein refolding chaperone